jgi:hypothetical protein
MLELTQTIFLTKKIQWSSKNQKAKDEATNAQLPQTIGTMAIKEMKPMPRKEMVT